MNKMMFITSTKGVQTLAKPQEVALISIKGRDFEYAGRKAFYERVKTGDTYLYIKWFNKSVNLGASGPYGSTYPESSMKTYSSMSGFNQDGTSTYSGTGIASGTPNRKIIDVFSVNSQNKVCLKINDKFKEFDSAKSYLKIFKDKQHAEDISQYITKEGIDFKNLKDIQKLVLYSEKYIGKKEN